MQPPAYCNLGIDEQEPPFDPFEDASSAVDTPGEQMVGSIPGLEDSTAAGTHSHEGRGDAEDTTCADVAIRQNGQRAERNNRLIKMAAPQNV